MGLGLWRDDFQLQRYAGIERSSNNRAAKFYHGQVGSASARIFATPTLKGVED
jgi:hypothetical protein